ncbi:hypothetical protein [Salinicoccus sp. HZC-1]|uniref:hypothetical protein n=1 Tax=Salinicoccus sp. HZC-1 TaxID=3385497 RepID=UPI00398AC53D
MILLIGILTFLTVGCNKQQEDGTNDNAERPTESTTEESTTEESTTEESTAEQKQNMADSETEPNTEENQNKSAPLDGFSAKEIEYARVYLQLGPNPDIEELYVKHIPAGTKINRQSENSLEYPEDVIQLTGARLVDGAVTYSGNGDGTVNLYNVPKRWGDADADMRETTKNIINTTETVYIEARADEKVADLASRIIYMEEYIEEHSPG